VEARAWAESLAGGPRGLDDLRRMLARVAGEAAAYLRDRFGLEELLHVVGQHLHDDDEGMRIDVESEKNLLELLRAEGYRGLFLGEESGLVRLGDDPYIVVADPLDGSKNYAGLIPWNAVSLAVAPLPRQGGEPRLDMVVAGAVAPVTQWPVLSFARGRGAYEGGASVEARPRREPRIVLAYVERPEQARVVYEYLRICNGHRRSVRALGSASLEIAWAGLGRAEVFIDVRGRLRVVDVAAAVWFAHEAGAVAAVERPDASLARVERVGSVVVAYSEEAWASLRRALEATGHEHLAERVLG
jgi:myo-inositol-1(or 4)-monophosphatase